MKEIFFCIQPQVDNIDLIKRIELDEPSPKHLQTVYSNPYSPFPPLPVF
jgi:hypothetical protein